MCIYNVNDDSGLYDSTPVQPLKGYAVQASLLLHHAGLRPKMRHGTTTLYVTGQDNLGEVVAWLTHRNDSVQIHTMARFSLSRRREFRYFLLYYKMLCGCEGKSQRQQCSIKAEHVERRSVYNALLWITPQT